MKRTRNLVRFELTETDLGRGRPFVGDEFEITLAVRAVSVDEEIVDITPLGDVERCWTSGEANVELAVRGIVSIGETTRPAVSR